MTKSLIEREHEIIFQTYKRLPIVVERAEGCRIYDKEGNSYLDFLAGIAVNALGHSNSKIITAVEKQIRKFMHLSNYFYQEPQIALAEKLMLKTSFDRVFFTNSGTEAVEGAIKLARRWGSLNGKTEIISFTGGFHGRTYGALSLMEKPLYKKDMGPYLSNIRIIPYNDIEAFRSVANEKTSAVILEFLQGEGGITAANKEFVNTIFDLKEKFAFLLIADEIQTGVGRTGKFFGFEHYDVQPDIATLAKGIGGGLPLGAIIAKEHLAEVWEKGMHGTTNGGNAVSCAAGLVVLDELENGLLQHVVEIGNYLHEKLEDVKREFPDSILEVRGKGLMKGLLLSFDADKLKSDLLEKRVIANATSGNVLRLVPPLIITENEVDEFVEALRKCLDSLNKQT